MQMSPRKITALLAVAVLTTVAASAASRSERFELSHALAAGQSVTIDTASFDIAVEIGGTELNVVADVKVKGSPAKLKSLLEKYRPRIVEKDGRVIVKTTPGHSSWSLFGGSGDQVSGRLKVTLPSETDLTIDTASGDVELDGDLGGAALHIDAASGDVELRGAAASVLVDTASGDVTIRADRRIATVEADAASGDVTVHGPVGKLLADTASGDIHLHGAIEELDADAASGDVIGEELTGSASVDTASGDVALAFAALPAGARIDVDTTSGAVVLHIPSGLTAEGTLDTTSGRIESDLAGDLGKRGRSFRFAGPGDVTISVSTTSGGVRALEGR